jgi:hypothetical protein
VNLSAVNAPTINADVSASTISADVSASAISFQAQVEYFKLVYEVGIFLLILEHKDAVPISDATRRDFAKLLAHTTAVVDQYALAYGLNKAETFRIADAHFKDLKKVFGGSGSEERFSARDLYAYLLDKPLVDSFKAADKAVLEIGKALLDGGGAAERAFKETTKVLADLWAAAEHYIAEVGKNIADTARFSDVARRDFGKALNDAVGSTDDADGLLTIEDDQEFDFFKFTADRSVAVDTFVRTVQFDRRLPEPYAYDFFEQEYVNDEIIVLRDAIALVPQKSLLDTTGASDLFYRQVNYVRSLGDGVGATDDVDGLTTDLDDQELETGKALRDISNVSDLIAIALSRALSEFSAVTDVRVFAVGKTFADAAGATDVRALTPGKVLAHTSRATDSAAKFFGKASAEMGRAADQMLRAPGLVKVDTTSISDVGSLINQSYCSDGLYFAGDFVGASRIF